MSFSGHLKTILFTVFDQPFYYLLGGASRNTTNGTAMSDWREMARGGASGVNVAAYMAVAWSVWVRILHYKSDQQFYPPAN